MNTNVVHLHSGIDVAYGANGPLAYVWKRCPSAVHWRVAKVFCFRPLDGKGRVTPETKNFFCYATGVREAKSYARSDHKPLRSLAWNACSAYLGPGPRVECEAVSSLGLWLSACAGYFWANNGRNYSGKGKRSGKRRVVTKTKPCPFFF